MLYGGIAAAIVLATAWLGYRWHSNKTDAQEPADHRQPSVAKVKARDKTRLARMDNPKSAWVNSVDGLGYVLVPNGTLNVKGSPRPIQIQSYWIGETEVTQAAWTRVMSADNPSSAQGTRLPVENVTWAEADKFCRTVGGRLPNDDEWQFAATGGTSDTESRDQDSASWYSVNSGGVVHPVALKAPNRFGIYDMLGNVREWIGASERTVADRGGSWVDTPDQAFRRDELAGNGSGYRSDLIGFRCAGTPSTFSKSLVKRIQAPENGASKSSKDVIFTGGDVTPAEVIEMVPAGYTPQARKARITGSVELSVVVDSSGRPRDIRVVKSLDPGLDRKAVEAVRRWRFRPGMRDGKPVSTRPPPIEINFSLE